MGLRIAHIADTHLGYRYSVLPNRDDDFASSWLHACRSIVESQPDIIIHAGDVFHTHRPDWKALRAFNKGLSILREAQVPIFIIAGNHDTSGVHTVHNVFTYTSDLYAGVFITNDDLPVVAEDYHLDLSVVLVPHRALLNPALTDEVEKIWSGLDGKYRILVSHGGISGDPGVHEPGSVAIPDAITKHEWNYMAFGHLHLSQPHGRNGWYSGSTERCGWSDYPASPAWTLVDIHGVDRITHHQVPVPHMDFIELPDFNAQDMSTAVIVGDVVDYLETIKIPEERCHIRVKMLNLPTSQKQRVENMLRRTAGKDHPKAVISVNLDSPISYVHPDFNREIQSDLKPLQEMFRDFVEEQQYEKEDFKERFLEKGLDLIGQAELNEGQDKADEY